MKTSILYTTLFILTASLFSGCGTRDSFSKKQYNKRYYIDMTDAEPALAEENKHTEEILEKPTTQVVTTTADADKKNSTNEPFYHASGIPETGSDNDNNIFDDLSESRRSTFNTFQQESEYPSILTADDETEKTELNSASDDDVLSLLWIVILIIFILWLIGALTGGFGVGGAVHLLLVIVLILLILWLLGII